MNNQKITHINKVGMKTDPVKLPTSIQLPLMEGKQVKILAIGKKAVYIAIKAVCITEGFAV
ncbi:stage V sporulation protein S [Clostridium sp. SHJSY1]|uniref:stage V sporulation protein S n=1 Tax=Clostridium sp. SHJSY1 TaxID=2942483 RepID=UPI002874041B|nr:stage V sporulation protein S [Clostridium sp. SHJSY1]MDS0527141.1 stage V sporulation protein S [Clostridium sp. SHJSY1]